jgi:hypothetical protein
VIAFLLGSPVNLQLRPASSTQSRQIPVQADVPVRAQQSILPLK